MSASKSKLHGRDLAVKSTFSNFLGETNKVNFQRWWEVRVKCPEETRMSQKDFNLFLVAINGMFKKYIDYGEPEKLSELFSILNSVKSEKLTLLELQFLGNALENPASPRIRENSLNKILHPERVEQLKQVINENFGTYVEQHAQEEKVAAAWNNINMQLENIGESTDPTDY